MEQRIYTPAAVVRIARSYIDFQLTFQGQAQQIIDPQMMTVTNEHPFVGERPLGMRASDTRPWPFREPQHARLPFDGKAKALKMQDIHAMMMDFEEGVKHMADDDLTLIYSYHVCQTRTLDELCREFNITSRGAMSARIHRAVRRLSKIMENPQLYGQGRGRSLPRSEGE